MITGFRPWARWRRKIRRLSATDSPAGCGRRMSRLNSRSVPRPAPPDSSHSPSFLSDSVCISIFAFFLTLIPPLGPVVVRKWTGTRLRSAENNLTKQPFVVTFLRVLEPPPRLHLRELRKRICKQCASRILWRFPRSTYVLSNVHQGYLQLVHWTVTSDRACSVLNGFYKRNC